MSIDRNKRSDTLSKSLQSRCKLDMAGETQTNDLVSDILLTCQLNAYAEPAILEMEQIPIDSPAENSRRHATDTELYFLQWVFSGLFQQLNQLIKSSYKGYKILRPEVEPGISWEDFRSGRRALLLWLVRSESHTNALTALEFFVKNKTNLKKFNEPQFLWDRCDLLPRAIFKELHDLKLEMQNYKNQMSKTEANIENILQIIRDTYASNEQRPLTTTDHTVHESSGHDGGEWSVVENADESDAENNVISESISGYEDSEDSDI